MLGFIIELQKLFYKLSVYAEWGNISVWVKQFSVMQIMRYGILLFEGCKQHTKLCEFYSRRLHQFQWKFDQMQSIMFNLL